MMALPRDVRPGLTRSVSQPSLPSKAHHRRPKLFPRSVFHTLIFTDITHHRANRCVQPRPLMSAPMAADTWHLNASALNLSATQLDVSGLIYAIPGFLSEEHVRHIHRIAQASRTLATGSYASVEVTRPWERGSDAIIADVEYRIGSLVGLPPHPAESPMRISVNRPWRPMDTAPHPDEESALQNLHIDTNEAPRRVVTVLLYLTDEVADGLDGGVERRADTSYPCG